MSGNFVIYLLGYIVAIAGLAYGLHAAGVGEQWIAAAVLVLAGLGMVYALSRSNRDRSRGQVTTAGQDRVVNQVNSTPQQSPGPTRSYQEPPQPPAY